jgi:hypothetical protein
VGGGAVSGQLRDGLLLLAISLFRMTGCVYFYIAGKLDGDRALSSFAALVFVVFGVEVVVLAARIL